MSKQFKKYAKEAEITLDHSDGDDLETKIVDSLVNLYLLAWGNGISYMQIGTRVWSHVAEETKDVPMGCLKSSQTTKD